MSIATRTYDDNNDVSRTQIVHNGSVAGSTGDVAAVRETGAEIDFGGSASGDVFDAISAAGTFSSAISCAGGERIILKVETSKASPSIKLRVWLKDSTGTGWTPLPVEAVTNTGVQGSASGAPSLKTSYYHGDVVSVPTYGATSFKVEAKKLNTGYLSVWSSVR